MPEQNSLNTKPAESGPSEKQIVVFRLGSERFGIVIELVREILRHQEVTHVPKAAAGLLGVIDLRGQVTPVMALDTRLQLPPSERTSDSRIMVVDVDGREIGMVVDEVIEVVRFASDLVDPIPMSMRVSRATYVNGIARLEEGLTILLDIERIALDVDLSSLDQAAQLAEAQPRSGSPQAAA